MYKRQVNHANAQLVELGSKKKGIGIETVGGEQLRTHCDDFGPHRGQLTVQGKPFDVPVESVKSIIGGDDGAMRGQKRQSHDVASAENEFRLGLRSEAYDSATPAKRSPDI